MTTRFYLVFFVVAVFWANAEVLDSDLLLAVFGQTQADPVVGSHSQQANVVSPYNETLVDPDYWDSEDSYTPVAADYDKFDWTLTKRVASLSNDNFLLSPLGLKLALAILAEAATGPTQAEISSVLGFDLDRTVVRRKFSSIIESLKWESTEYILNLGSRIYISAGVQPRQRFAAIAEQFYKTELRKIDFNNITAAVGDINNWVSSTTHGRIPKLVSEDDVAAAVVLILNTLYFKGNWRHQFNPAVTRKEPFFVTPQRQVSVPFMTTQSQFYYGESTKFDAKIVRMAYKGNKFAMYIIVPNSLTGLPHIFNGLSDLRREIDLIKERKVEVTMPLFKFDYKSHLDGVLKEMGVRQAFEDTASFPGIARGQSLQQRLKMSKVMQKSGIDVNEIGSEAYAATEISLVNKFGEDDVNAVEVIANRPFLFFIQDEHTRQLVFTGRVSDPSLAEGNFKL